MSYLIPPSAVQYNNFVSARTVGPLNTAQTPAQMEYHHNGVLTGIHPNPPQFYPADGASEFSRARHQYWRTATSNLQQRIAREKALSAHSNFFSMSTHTWTPVSTHMNYIQPPASSMYTQTLKSRAVGKSSYKVGLPADSPLSCKSYNVNDVKSQLGRLRRAGCAAPAKKGAIFANVHY